MPRDHRCFQGELCCPFLGHFPQSIPPPHPAPRVNCDLSQFIHPIHPTPRRSAPSSAQRAKKATRPRPYRGLAIASHTARTWAPRYPAVPGRYQETYGTSVVTELRRILTSSTGRSLLGPAPHARSVSGVPNHACRQRVQLHLSVTICPSRLTTCIPAATRLVQTRPRSVLRSAWSVSTGLRRPIAHCVGR